MPTSTLFNDLPASLFAPLAAPDAATYAKILSDLFAESRRAPQPLHCDLVLDIIISHTITSHTADDPLPQARETLRYLEECGWLRTQIQPDFTTACVLTPHAFQLLQIVGGDSSTIVELLVAIHDLLKAALLDVDNEHRISEAARLTGRLHSRLKELQHNADANDSLPDLTRLRTAVLDAASKLEIRGHAPARYIREQFQSFDRILNDIAARSAQYGRSTPAHAGGARVERSDDHATIAQLTALLSRLATSDKKTFAKYAGGLIHLYCQPQSPTVEPPSHRTTEPFVPDDIPLPEPSADEIDSARREIMRQFNRPISRERVGRLAESILHGQLEARAADIVVAGSVDLPLLIQLRLHGDGSLGYRIEDGTWIEVNGLSFRDFIMKNLNYAPPAQPEPTQDATATDVDSSQDESPILAEEAPSE
ncbi:MAG: Wadjet anti-phage system protein JetA family protein [Chloroflexota bacterium]